jgi:hypothetical protein
MGIVSALGRSHLGINTRRLHPDRRRDQPGNSGGALIDAAATWSASTRRSTPAPAARWASASRSRCPWPAT